MLFEAGKVAESGQSVDTLEFLQLFHLSRQVQIRVSPAYQIDVAEGLGYETGRSQFEHGAHRSVRIAVSRNHDNGKLCSAEIVDRAYLAQELQSVHFLSNMASP